MAPGLTALEPEVGKGDQEASEAPRSGLLEGTAAGAVLGRDDGGPVGTFRQADDDNGRDPNTFGGGYLDMLKSRTMPVKPEDSGRVVRRE